MCLSIHRYLVHRRIIIILLHRQHIVYWCTFAYIWNCVHLLQSYSDRQCEKYMCGYAGCVEASRELVSYSSSFNHQPVFRGGGSPRWLHLLQIVFLVIAAYPVFCNPVDHFAETFRSLWFLLPKSNESRHLVFAMLFLIATIVKKRWSTFTSYGRSARCRGREPLTAHLAGTSFLPPSHRHRNREEAAGRNPHHVTTHKSASAACGHNASTSRHKQCESCDARHSGSTAFTRRAAFDSTKKRWVINHGWLQHTQIQTTIWEKYSSGHAVQIQSLAANKSESRTATNMTRQDMLFLGKYVEWFWFWWETASSQLCHKPQCPSCLGLGKFERWWFVRKFPPHHPLLLLGHMFASNITTISLFKYLLSGYQSSICQPAVIYLSEITNISARRTIDGRFRLNMSYASFKLVLSPPDRRNTLNIIVQHNPITILRSGVWF